MSDLTKLDLFYEYNRHQLNMKCENCGHGLKKHHLRGEGDTDWCSAGMRKGSHTVKCECYNFFSKKQIGYHK